VALQICNTFIVSKTLRLELEKNSGSHDLERQQASELITQLDEGIMSCLSRRGNSSVIGWLRPRNGMVDISLDQNVVEKPISHSDRLRSRRIRNQKRLLRKEFFSQRGDRKAAPRSGAVIAVSYPTHHSPIPPKLQPPPPSP